MSLSPAAIKLDQVSKRYLLGTRLPGPAKFIRRVFSGSRSDEVELWALKDVTFSVHYGEVVGIIGPNGAGKTTILKILAGVTRPTDGSMQVNGNLSALIELGAGFHPELTGLENIYLNGSILGMKRRQIERLVDDIVSFAELESFIDTPVKRYSTGMYARLGFSIAIHVDPDILLVDEVLSVGDLSFQRKSLKRMLKFRKEAKAMVFVSHNLASIQAVCDRVLWLEQGGIRMEGPPSEVVPAYQSGTLRKDSQPESNEYGSNGRPRDAVSIGSVVLEDKAGKQIYSIRPGDRLSVRTEIYNSSDPCEVTVALSVYDRDGEKLCETSSTTSDRGLALESGINLVQVVFDRMPLVPGNYYLNAAVSERYMVQLDHKSNAASFEVSPLPDQVIVRGPLYLSGDWSVLAAADSIA